MPDFLIGRRIIAELGKADKDFTAQSPVSEEILKTV